MGDASQLVASAFNLFVYQTQGPNAVLRANAQWHFTITSSFRASNAESI